MVIVPPSKSLSCQHLIVVPTPQTIGATQMLVMRAYTVAVISAVALMAVVNGSKVVSNEVCAS
jgi:hypothetical protein